jgi:hypothetical protein
MLTGIAMLVSDSLEQQLAELAPFAMGTGDAGAQS